MEAFIKKTIVVTLAVIVMALCLFIFYDRTINRYIIQKGNGYIMVYDRIKDVITFVKPADIMHTSILDAAYKRIMEEDKKSK